MSTEHCEDSGWHEGRAEGSTELLEVEERPRPSGSLRNQAHQPVGDKYSVRRGMHSERAGRIDVRSDCQGMCCHIPALSSGATTTQRSHRLIADDRDPSCHLDRC